jgi:hypothetical protein
MKTIIIEQVYDLTSKITFVTGFYRGKSVYSSIMEFNECLEYFTFPVLMARGFTHWKSKNGCIGIRKMKVVN